MKSLASTALGSALNLLAIVAFVHGTASGRAEAADTTLRLFAPATDVSRQALAPAQAERLAAYRSDRAAAEVTLVRLPLDALKGAAAAVLNLPAAGEIPLDVASVDQRSAADFSWSAKGAGGSEVSLVAREGNVVGTIRSGGRLYRLQPLGGGAAALVRVDQSKMPPDHPPGSGPLTRGHSEQPRGAAQGSAATAADSGAEFTAIVAYTAGAAAWAGDIDALIQLAHDETNQGYANSGVTTKVRVVHKYKTGYADSGAMHTDLTRFQTTGDGHADEVHARRDANAADVAILLLAPSDYCGVAYLYPEATYAFGVVGVNCATGNYTFGHEIGHIQGALHDPETDPETYPFPYGHGYRYPAGGWRTIMAYACPAPAYCARVNHWANPNVRYGGVPTGTAAVSHDARVLNETAVRVANFRTGAPPPPAGWQPWTGRGGSVASFPECERTGTRIDCWAQTSGGRLAWNRSADGTSWSGWVDLGGSGGSTPECVVRGGRIDCFTTTPARRLALITYNGSSWGSWTDLGGAVTNRPACVAGAGLALDCFASGADKTLHRRSFDGTAWKPWEKLGGSTANRPECVARSGGIDCFVVDGSKNLHTRRLGGGKWGAWTRLGTGFGLAPHCLVSGSKLDCFAQSASSGLLKGYFDGTRWSKWPSVAGSSGVNTQPYCNRVGSGFDCYWTNKAFDLVRRQRSGPTWLAEQNLDGSVQQRPVCMPATGGRVDCLVRGLDNSLQQRTRL